MDNTEAELCRAACGPGTRAFMIKPVDETRGQDVVIKATRQQWLPIGVCLFGSALGVILIFYGISHDGMSRILALAAGILGTLVIAPSAVYLICRAARDRPALVLGERGFTDHASITGVGYIAWDEVAGMRPDRVWVAIKLHDPGPVIARQPAWRRALMRMNSRFVPGDVIIPTSPLAMPPPELINLMIDRIQRSRECER
jgi:hypothetical protein